MSNNGNTIQVAPAAQGGVPVPPADQAPTDLKSSKFDSGIALVLHTWQDLTVAVQNSWGGPNSSEKRDWFAGAISDLFTNPEAPSPMDPDYLEEFMLNVMFDEFEVVIEDESCAEVAELICKLAKQCADGEFAGVAALEVRYRERKGKDAMVGKIITREEVEEDGDSVDDESDEDEDEADGDAMDVDQPRMRRERPPVEVDEEGFTTVRRR